MYSELPALRTTEKACWEGLNGLDQRGRSERGEMSAHAVEVERVRAAWRLRDVERELDGGPRRERVDAPLGEQRLCGLVAAQNLEEHRHTRGIELGVVDGEVGLGKMSTKFVRGYIGYKRTALKPRLRWRG